jgi:hypothetical protein
MMISDAILVDNYLFSLPLAYGNKEKTQNLCCRKTYLAAGISFSLMFLKIGVLHNMNCASVYPNVA